ncbi:MAG: helix-turn-helix transcriptional regulator [candidate division WOR-3 bacterium]|nr:MAG: helix-turn-helix transcriptional regulator [candidate division WOR-3 bacterium]
MDAESNLLSLELLRDFVARVVPYDVYLKNLVIDKVETCNRRLWALRESMGIEEEDFASLFRITFEEYHNYERNFSPVSSEFLQKVAEEFSVSIEWLRCERPILPIPVPRRGDPKGR